jgi:hypothetical protein
MSEKTPAQDAETQGDPSVSVKTGSAEEPKENSGLISGAPKKLVSPDGSPPNPTKKSVSTKTTTTKTTNHLF